ncbi:MAG: Holliday junction branch migration protein RuvA [Candidatus Levybacteria bacterium]|nr:Holliday junction branch migration protein RuvA [Candidatus Levybacteria bacterium]
MIGFLRGEIVFKEGNYIIIDVGGIGYKVFVAQDVISKSNNNSHLKLFTYTHVREDAISLFGFLDSLDLKLFEDLISVSGIGPKTAMNIFSVGTREEITQAIISGDVVFFTGIPRLGKKNAQKIIIELKSKLGSVEDLDLTKIDVKENSEVIAALRNFGFNNKEALDALKAIEGKGKTTEGKIRLALKYLGK